MRSIAINVSVCLFVCLSARMSQNHMSKFHQIFRKCHPWLWLGPPLTAIRYVMYFRFVDDVITANVSSSSPGGGTGAKLPFATASCLVNVNKSFTFFLFVSVFVFFLLVPCVRFNK